MLNMKMVIVTRRSTVTRRPHVIGENGFSAWNRVLEGRGFLVMITASLGLKELQMEILPTV